MISRRNALALLRKTSIGKFIAGYFFVYTILILLYLSAQAVYREFATGDFLLNVKSVTTAKEVAAGDPLNFVICREPRYSGIISSSNIRSFYRRVDSTDIVIAGETTLPNVAYERTNIDCLSIFINPDKYPQEPGNYYFCQQVKFSAWEKEKIATFCSTNFVVK